MTDASQPHPSPFYWPHRALAAETERDRYREALQDIADDLGHPGDPAWRRAMEALGLDADAAERAWHD